MKSPHEHEFSGLTVAVQSYMILLCVSVPMPEVETVSTMGAQNQI